MKLATCFYRFLNSCCTFVFEWQHGSVYFPILSICTETGIVNSSSAAEDSLLKAAVGLMFERAARSCHSISCLRFISCWFKDFCKLDSDRAISRCVCTTSNHQRMSSLRKDICMPLLQDNLRADMLRQPSNLP